MFIRHPPLVVCTLTWNVLMYRIYQVISTVGCVYMAVLSLSHSHHMSIAHTLVDINEEPLKTSQTQTESKTLSAPTLTQSRIPRPSNAPPDEEKDKGTSKIPFEST